MQFNTRKIIEQLTKLGFIINHQKSDLQPKKIQGFLGFTFNTTKMRISVPQQKLSKLLTKIKKLQTSNSIQTCRWIAGLLGKITAMIPALGEALIRIRYLQSSLARNLRQHQHRWDSPCPLSSQ